MRSVVRFSFNGDNEEEEGNEELISNIHNLREFQLITKILLIFVSFTTVIGAISFVIPYVYAIIPVYETT
jgi:hypothetical protein